MENQKDTGVFIQWNPKYEIGIPKIDSQHKHLVELCNRLHESIVSDNPLDQKHQLAATLKECVAYVGTHFKDEETLLTAAGYENFPSHKAQHDTFTKKVLETAQNFNAQDRLAAIKFVKFLYEWLISHISYEDKKYVPCLSEYLRKNPR